MRSMTSHLAALILFSSAASAMAADLTDADSRYLDQTFGLSSRSEVITNMTPEERAELRAVIIGKGEPDYAYLRNPLVLSKLTAIYADECGRWKTAHATPACPPVADAKSQPGKEVADRQCNSCHLFGTAEAPSFALLARRRSVTADYLMQSTAKGHAMSPIKLSAGETGDLAVYIQSLK